jgi:hypothetical protein
MKNKISVLLLFVGVYLLSSYPIMSQCIKDISTNPAQPRNDEFLPMMNSWFPNNNSFRNSFINWKFPNKISIDLGANWSHPITSSATNIYPMVNPFGPSMPSEFLYLYNDRDVNYGDFHWEDGWELLWSNLGYFPNGDPTLAPGAGTYYQMNNRRFNPSPPNIPYFVLYIRYTGLMRLFANV